jgi:RNA polymerase sigma-70 factor (ECF subfamily)
MDLEKLSDKELMMCMNNGQKEKAFTILYNRHKKPLQKFCLKLSRDPELSQDITQDTLQKLWEKSGTFIRYPNSSFKTWLYQIAKHRFFDYNSKCSSNREFSFSYVDSRRGEENEKDRECIRRFFLNPSPSPEDNFLKKEKKEYLNWFLKKFKFSNPKYSNLINLRYFRDFSHDEITKETGFKLINVKASLSHARKNLNNMLIKNINFFLEV